MARITSERLDQARLWAAVSRPDCGAAVVFTGTARQFTGEHETACLYFEAYEPMALRELQRLEDTALQEFDIKSCLIEHRLGAVPIGETTIVVAIASPHRQAAFDAVSWVMNELKRRVPIWKKDVAPTGQSAWVPNQIQSTGF
jgi:molybdopterin synthase catalytic subunit